jgi:hypothetical protein
MFSNFSALVMALVMALLGSVFTMLVVGSGEHFTYTSAVDFSTLAS